YKDDGLIDWSRDARSIHNQVRGMNPVPGAFTKLARGNLKIQRTRIMDETAKGSPGLIESSSPKDGFVVSCGKGSLKILEIQPPGKKVMDGASFVRGYRVAEGIYITEL
ncbi:MAG TPA: methionyl-tRNA formyltransferase, partial [bacterium]|nr:methionyl-tRNA formyltransferase [bacterium]